MTQLEKVYEYLRHNSNSKAADIAKGVGLSIAITCAHLTTLVKQGKAVREKKGYMFVYTATNPIVKEASSELVAKHTKSLSEYSPRELLEELKRKGYIWDKMWVETRQYVEYANI